MIEIQREMLKKIESKKVSKIYVESQNERKKEDKRSLRKDERKKEGKRYTKKREEKGRMRARNTLRKEKTRKERKQEIH